MSTLAEEDPIRAIRNACERVRRIVEDDGVTAELAIIERALLQVEDRAHGVRARGLGDRPGECPTCHGAGGMNGREKSGRIWYQCLKCGGSGKAPP